MADPSIPAHPQAMKAQLERTTTLADAPLPSPIFTTPRLLVRNMHPNDAPSMASNADNPAVSKHMSIAFGSPYTLTHAEGWIKMNQMAQPSHFAICERSAPDVVIGGIGMKLGADVNAHTAEVGYWIGEKYWGVGYATEILDGFDRWAFEQWEKDGKRVTKLWGTVFSENKGSMRCLEKCGYSREGVLKDHVEKDGVVMDTHCFGLTKGDWEKIAHGGLKN